MKKIVKYLLLVLIIFLSTTTVNASTRTFERKEEENYGVNKKWQITDKNKENVLNTKSVDASEKIYDFSDILTDQEEEILKERIDRFIEKYEMDMVIVTDNYPYQESMKSYCYNDDISDRKIYEYNDIYAGDFYDYNDFGLDLSNYSGVMIFRNTAIDPCYNERYYDMYTFGDAQLYFNQNRYDYILDGIYSDMKGQNYLNAFSSFISRTSSYIDLGAPSDMKGYTVDDNGFLQPPPLKYHPPIAVGLFVGLIIASIIVAIMVSKNKMVKKAKKAGEYLDTSSVNITTRIDQFLRTHTTSYRISSSSGGGGHSGGGFSSHGGSSGGGHSSGGGRHG